jgi:hypothetical protein
MALKALDDHYRGACRWARSTTSPSSVPTNHGYRHIVHHSRGHYMARKALDNHYRESLTLSLINNISRYGKKTRERVHFEAVVQQFTGNVTVTF